MTQRLVNFGLMALSAVLFLTQIGCMGEPPRIEAPYINADDAGQEAIKQFDANHDGKISGTEFDKAPSLLMSITLGNFNTTKDKGITAADITGRIKAWQATKAGRCGGITCTITRNGKPLGGADVKFVPEKFLGDKLPEGSGKTGSDGVALITVPLIGTDDAPGLPPGFYRVEVTMPDGSIPAKYNTQTIFGDEIYPDKRRDAPRSYDIK
jgi:hypothetical protein